MSQNKTFEDNFLDELNANIDIKFEGISLENANNWSLFTDDTDDNDGDTPLSRKPYTPPTSPYVSPFDENPDDYSGGNAKGKGDNSILMGENIDVSKFAKYKDQLLKLIKIKDSEYQKMSDNERTLLFTNFFKFVAEEYFNQYGIKIESDDDTLDFCALLMATDKEFSKKLRKFAQEYIAFVHTLWRKKQLEHKKMNALRKEALILMKFLKTKPSAKTFSTFVTGGAKSVNGKIVLANPHTDPNLQRRNLAFSKVKNFLNNNNKLNGNRAKKIDPCLSFNKVGYQTIASNFNPDNFYNLDKDDVINLMVRLTTVYCEQNGAEPPVCETGHFESLPDNKITLGANYPATNTIVFNQAVIDRFDNFKKTKDPRYPLLLMETALHEAHHTVQTNNGTFENFNSGKISTNDDFKRYENLPEEVDARHSSRETLRQMADAGLLSPELKKVYEQKFGEPTHTSHPEPQRQK